MRAPSSRIWLGLLVLLVALGGAACSIHHPRRMTIAAFERLRLEARLGRSQGALGETIPVRYSLLNLGRRGVRGCVTYEAGFHEIGTRPELGSVLDSGSQACKKPPFELGPGQTLQWDGEIQIRDVAPGVATLWTFVRIADLASCGPHGCEARSLMPGPLSLRVIERRVRDSAAAQPLYQEKGAGALTVPAGASAVPGGAPAVPGEAPAASPNTSSTAGS